MLSVLAYCFFVFNCVNTLFIYFYTDIWMTEAKTKQHDFCSRPPLQGIISDLYSGVTLPKPDYSLMEAAMRETCVEMNFQPPEYFFLKTIQLYEMIVVRHGLMIVGLPFSGKTASYRVLAGALTKMHARGEEGQVGRFKTLNLLTNWRRYLLTLHFSL
jgi:hypothetical protein